ncbi:MAG: glycosyltransferase family 2 protein [bacterium]|nr:glycosyltransferase family 2 protein [bacterium]
MIGIVILTYNTWKDTLRCIQSIYQSECRQAYHLYLVDNASPIRPDEEFFAALEAETYTYVCAEKNLGYSAGNNIGIRYALQDACDAILIANNDVTFQKNCIDLLYAYLQKHPQTGIVGPKIYDLNGQLQRKCMSIKTGPREKYLLRTRLYLLFPFSNRRYWCMNRDYEKETFHPYAVLGCCFLMSRNCAEQITPFDENTFLYEEEFIIGIRMQEAKLKTTYFPRAVIWHLHGGSTHTVRAFAYICKIQSEIYYCRAYLGMSKAQIFPLYCYRTALYLLKGIRNSEFRENWKKYKQVTHLAFEKNYHSGGSKP